MKAEWSTDPSEFADYATQAPVGRLDDVIDAVEALPVDLRNVVNACFWERLSAPQAIVALDISAATFYRRLAEAKRRLVDVLRTDVPSVEPGETGEGVDVFVPPQVGGGAVAAGGRVSPAGGD